VPSGSTQFVPSRLRRLFRSPRNIFGLFRQYYSEEPPSHDPEEHVDLHELSDCTGAARRGLPDVSAGTEGGLGHRPNDKNAFYPYPNESSFRLGNWYWNNGAQKSRESFRELLSIVGDSEFRPEDVRHTQWSKIDVKLGGNDFDREEGVDKELVDVVDAEWMDEDAGWKKTPIVISVPFHSKTKEPGPKEFVAGDLYHRSFVSVIREKLANPHDDRLFHYEPFELFWQPPDTNEERVHGELYTSPAFLDAHRELQDSPGEPGCNLPKVVVAMMFWSDATHLTSFGDAKLWPTYLYFGNESKYRRCKPSSHLCNHVAYFQAVSLQQFQFFIRARC
jgi:Plavaka transposase